jgi:C1A family cysteine protease
MAVTTHRGRTFDWVQRHDPESRRFGIVREVEDVPTKAIWHIPGKVLDQGSEGACVGHGITAEATSSPVRVRLADPQATAFDAYEWCRRNDEYPGEQYDGTSTNAGMKYGREHGWWEGYRWCFSMDDVKRALTVGPVVIGINWYADMYETDPNGLVRVGGQLVGGHCLLVNGWSPNLQRRGWGEVYRWRNSWGRTYGVNAHGWIKAADLTRLLITERGEAAVPVGRLPR